MQLGQAEGAVDVLDVAKHTAGAARGELLIISDQPYVRTPSDSKLDGTRFEAWRIAPPLR